MFNWYGGVGMAYLLALRRKKSKIFIIEKNIKKQHFLKKFNLNVIKNEDIKKL